MVGGIPSIAIAIICAYIIGSFPTAYLMGRFRKGIDIRNVGSRNVGAMNVFYKVGFAEGILVLAVDIGKGVLAVALARWLGVPFVYQLVAGIAAVLGHAFPVFLKFHGGRGGATSIGVLIYVMPWGIPAYIVVLGLTLLATRYPTFSYGLAFICFPFIAWLVYNSNILVIFSVVFLLLLGIGYMRRIREMRSKGGSWRHVIMRKGLKDRL